MYGVIMVPAHANAKFIIQSWPVSILSLLAYSKNSDIITIPNKQHHLWHSIVITTMLRSS